MFIVFLCLILVKSTFQFHTSNPIWKTSIYFRAGQQNVINTLTGNDKTPNYTFTFSSALSGIPNIAYGIGKYQGIDYLMEEYFQIFRIGLTSSSFSVAVQITGSTSLYILRVPYLAIEPTFPHHLNTFDNTPLNYSAGQLVNITSRSATATTTYLNVINYTKQCTGRKYNKFDLPLAKYKMVLLMTSLFVSTVKQTSVAQNYSMDIRMEHTILTEQTYSIKVNLRINIIVIRLHFSQIIFDPIDIQSSHKYKLIYQLWEVNNLGGEKQIPQEFQDNFIMGISQCTTPHGYCGFDYMWDWKQNSTFFGVQIFQSITRKNVCAFNRIVSVVLYVQTWQCLSPYFYYNITSGLCQDQCGLYTYQSSQQLDIQIQYSCKSCQWGCSECNSSKACISCNNDDMRLFNGSCYCPHGFLDTFIVTKCQFCEDLNCLICQKNDNYKATPLPTDPIYTGLKNICIMCAKGYVLNDTTKGCDQIAKCNAAQNQLLNYETNQCQSCQINGCFQCRQTMQLKFNGTITDVMQVGTNRALTTSNPLGVVSCAQCDQQNQYFKNLTTKKCELCTLNKCINCTSLYSCAKCNIIEQYFLNQKTHLCEKCTLQACLNCENLTVCKQCDILNGYFLCSYTNVCKNCGIGCSNCSISSTNGSTTCKGCFIGLNFVNGQCSCDNGYFVQIFDSKTTCNLCDSKCKQCKNYSITCISCYFQQNRIFNKQSNLCECNFSNYMQSLLSLTCTKINTSLCDMGYFLSVNSIQCQQICGDGIKIILQCDDGNSIDKDGCSKQCKVQKNFNCDSQIYEKSICQYTGNIEVDNYNITKDPFDNIFTLQIKLIPQLVLYQTLNWDKGLHFYGNTVIQILQTAMKSSDILSIKAKYYQNIKYIDISLTFSLQTATDQVSQKYSQKSIYGQNRLLYEEIAISASNISFHFIQKKLDFSKTTNNLDVAYYPTQTYQTVRFFQTLFTIIMIIYIGLILLAVFFFKRIVPALTVFLSIQICFISLSSIQNVQPQTFSVINNFDQVFGLNTLTNLISQCTETQNITNFRNLKFQACFLSNINLMIIFELVAIVGIILMSLIQLRWKFATKYALGFKRALSNIAFFNLSNCVISGGIIDLNRSNFTDLGFIGFQGLLIVVQCILILKYKKTYFIQIEIQDYQIQKEQVIQQQKRRYKKQQISQDSQLSKKHSNEDILSREQNQQNKKSQEYNDKNEKQDKLIINNQVIYFVIFLFGIGLVCPLLYIFFAQKSSLICNLGSMAIISILIIIQLIFKPFNLTIKTNQHQLHIKPFTKLSINYYVCYCLMMLFMFMNVLFSVIQNNLEGQIQKKIYAMSILSYCQVGLFLFIMIYLVFAWSYSIYLSFFDEDIIARHNAQLVQRGIYEQKMSEQAYIDDQNKQQKNNRQQREYTIQQRINETTDYSEDMNMTIQIKKRSINNSQQHSSNLIFEMQQQQDSVQQDRF